MIYLLEFLILTTIFSESKKYFSFAVSNAGSISTAKQKINEFFLDIDISSY